MARLILACFVSFALVWPAFADEPEAGQEPPKEEQEEERRSDPLPTTSVPPAPKSPTGFRFGSYGRVQPSVNAQGGAGRRARIVFPSPRVDEGSYFELEFGYRPWNEDGVVVDTVATIAFTNDFFHFNGDFASTIAVRNLFGEVRGLLFDGSFLWVGSRMYRGDDVYLLDFWPLDNLNTYGGGFGWRGKDTELAWHLGFNRLDDAFQFQTVDVINERFVGSREVVFLDRQRLITSLKAEQRFGDYRNGDIGFKTKLYAELHHIPEGRIRREQPRLEEELPADTGFVIGAQFGVWNFLPRSFINLFVRYSRGLPAYGEMAIPFGLEEDKTSASANNLLIALSANFEREGMFGILVGGYARYFTDADRFEQDFDDGWDAAVAVRGMAYIGEYFTPGLELSYQMRRPNDVSPVSGVQETGGIFKISVLPAVTFGDGMYARPQFRLNYTVSFLDEAAQNLFPIDDVLRVSSVDHFFGFAVEWWFNSFSYGN